MSDSRQEQDSIECIRDMHITVACISVVFAHKFVALSLHMAQFPLEAFTFRNGFASSIHLKDAGLVRRQVCDRSVL